MSTCSIPSCNKRHEAKGYCVMHYKRWRKTGDPMTLTRAVPRPAQKRKGYYAIPLGVGAKDGYARVLESDKWLDKYKWHRSLTGYASARIEGKLVTMHTIIMETPRGTEVDHINGDKVDNRRNNLRLVSRSENMLNYFRLNPVVK